MKNRKLWISILAGALAVIMALSLVAGVLPSLVNAASISELEKQVAALKEEKKKIDADYRERDSKR